LLLLALLALLAFTCLTCPTCFYLPYNLPFGFWLLA
jgi:hypothetical protein